MGTMEQATDTSEEAQEGMEQAETQTEESEKEIKQSEEAEEETEHAETQMAESEDDIEVDNEQPEEADDDQGPVEMQPEEAENDVEQTGDSDVKQALPQSKHIRGSQNESHVEPKKRGWARKRKMLYKKHRLLHKH